VSSVVVLLGAPGSGKSAVGVGLAALGFRWREWERSLVERWGSRESFVANKTEALEGLHDEMLAFIDSADAAVAIETTGLSDAEFLDDLSLGHRMFVVRLDVSQAEATRRVALRASGRHLTDDIEPNRAIWRAFYETVAPRRHADLVIDTERTSPSHAAARIIEAMRSLGPQANNPV
jgi:shikimate kinase